MPHTSSTSPQTTGHSRRVVLFHLLAYGTAGALLPLLPRPLRAAELQGDYEALGPLPAPHSLGSVQFVEFLNFACPHCNTLRNAEEPYLRKYRGRLKVEYVPLLFPGQAPHALRLYYVAKRRGLAVQVKNLIFDSHFNYRVDINKPEIVVELAKLAGLEREYAESAEAPWVENMLRAGRKMADDAKVRATPTVVLAGVIKLEPKRSAAIFIQRIDDMTAQLLKK